MTDDNAYKYELKIQGLTQQVNDMNNALLDLRVELTVVSNERDALKAQLKGKESNGLEEAEAATDPDEGTTEA